jgi:type IV secretion system protein VirB10
MTPEQDDRRDDCATRAPIATRAAPPRPRRLSRKALTTLAGAGAFGVAGALAWSLSGVNQNAGHPESVSVAPRQGAEVLGDAPKDYGDLARTQAAAIGAPPATPPAGTEAASTISETGTTPAANAAEAEAQRRRQQAESARGSKLFAAAEGARRAQPEPDPTPAPAPLPGQAGAPAAPTGAAVQTVNSGRLVAPASGHMIMAGSTIAAALITGLSSDIPGQVIAQVTEDVFDTVTGQTKLIPQGARLIGDYDARVAHGQTRALVVWTRLILPDGRSIALDRMSATDGGGAAGLSDRVDNHWGSIVKAGLLSTLFGLGTELANTGDNDAIADAIRDSSGQTIGRAGDRIVERQLQIQPTITVRPGARVRVLVSRDLALEPWTGL